MDQEKQLEKLKKDIEVAEDKHEAVLVGINTDKQVKSDLEKQIQSLNKEIEKHHEDINFLDQKELDLKSSIKIEEEKLSDIKRESNEVNIELTKNKKLITELHADYANQSNELQREFIEKKKVLIGEIKILEDSVVDSKTIIEKNNNVISESESLIQQLKDERTSIESDILAKHKVKEEQTKEITKQTIDLDKFKKLFESGEIQLAELNENIVLKKEILNAFEPEIKEEQIKLEKVRNDRINEEKLFNEEVKKRFALVEKEQRLRQAKSVIEERYKMAGVQFDDFEI